MYSVHSQQQLKSIQTEQLPTLGGFNTHIHMSATANTSATANAGEIVRWGIPMPNFVALNRRLQFEADARSMAHKHQSFKGNSGGTKSDDTAEMMKVDNHQERADVDMTDAAPIKGASASTKRQRNDNETGPTPSKKQARRTQ